MPEASRQVLRALWRRQYFRSIPKSIPRKERRALSSAYTAGAWKLTGFRKLLARETEPRKRDQLQKLIHALRAVIPFVPAGSAA